MTGRRVQIPTASYLSQMVKRMQKRWWRMLPRGGSIRICTVAGAIGGRQSVAEVRSLHILPAPYLREGQFAEQGAEHQSYVRYKIHPKIRASGKSILNLDDQIGPKLGGAKSI